MSSPSSGSLPRLGPTWHRSSGNTGGRGFQPPPPATTRSRSGSHGSAGSDSTPKGGGGSQNKFSILDDDEEGGAGGPPFHTVERKSALRSHSFGSRKGGVGRSLADLAARVPASESGHHGHSMGGLGGGRFRRDSSTGGGLSLAQKMLSEEGKITRFTREKLLALRPRPENADEIPDFLKHLDGTAILSVECLDPVCWDTFDADEIWAQVKERQPRSSSMLISTKTGGPSPMGEGPRRSSAAPGFGKWQRGVALPPPDERRGSTHNKHNENTASDNPNDLWDDPLTSTDAAADFSAFGSIPDDPKDQQSMSSSSMTTFDYDKMTEATAKFEEELRRESSAGENGKNGDQPKLTKVDRNRPLSSSGLTIKSGSGDDVNVFEDFDEPDSEPDPPADETDSATEKEDSSAATEEEMIDDPPPAVSSLTQSNDASSRLMDMIGVTREKPKEGEKDEDSTPVLEKQLSQSSNPWANSDSDVGEGTPHTTKEVVTGLNLGNVTSLSSNPWGNPVLPAVPTATSSTNSTGYDLQQRLQQVAEEQNRKAQEAELQRRRQAEEEAQRRALAQKQAEQQARAQALQQQQQPQSGHSQVELILMERISQILENSWGRSDLGSILSTLHNDDSRVIPLLSNTDALRALIARHPQRVAMRHDPSLGADMAILVMTNVQWQRQAAAEQQQQQAHARQEELRRLEQQRRLSALAAQQKAQQEAQKAAAAANRPIEPSAPWFYSDPQGNVQGPFRGEEMRQWLEAGYFKGDLPISQEMSGPFRPLAAIFPDMTNAFRFGESEDSAAIAAAKAAEEERLAREEEERAERARAAAEEAARARAEEEAKAMAEAERKAREEAEAQARAAAEAAAEAERLRAETQAREQANDSSAQLKMMLGMSRSNNNGISGPSSSSLEPDLPEEPQQPPAPAPAPPKKQKKKSEKQQKAAPVPAPAPIPTPSIPVPTPTPNPPATAWGGAATAQKVTSRKSMSEIQQEEARAAALLAMERKATGRSNNSGWANVAAKGGGQGWQSGTVKPSGGQATVTGPNTMTMRPSSAPRSSRAVPNSSVSSVAAAQRQAAVNAAAKQRVSNQQQKPANAFGAKMSPQLESWCKDQMRKLNGSDDLTLVSFCMTLEDSDEIRQYLTAYLGSTAQVNNFATEFIHRKGGGTSKKEEWESTVKPKKGRKKK